MVGDYSDWQYITYKPAINEILPYALLPYLSRGQTVLDIGCNTGNVAFFLANHGIAVSGVDINAEAIETARQRADRQGLGSVVRFNVADILAGQDSGVFDAVLMIRLLTCFPELQSWNLLMERAFLALKPGGIIYINDFMLTMEGDLYQRRYEAGVKLGWRPGSFAVNDAEGCLLFIAHHHSEEELQRITSPYTQLKLHFYNSLSMNGNACRMFEFVGRKP